jgi:hypothetical protein
MKSTTVNRKRGRQVLIGEHKALHDIAALGREPREWPSYEAALHQSQLAPADNKFHRGNGDDGKHYEILRPCCFGC